MKKTYKSKTIIVDKAKETVSITVIENSFNELHYGNTYSISEKIATMGMKAAIASVKKRFANHDNVIDFNFIIK